MVSTTFTSTGFVSIGNTSNLFVDLAYIFPFATSAADTFITSQVSKQFTDGFNPTYFQIPYIFSACDNLINGKYTSSITQH